MHISQQGCTLRKTWEKKERRREATEEESMLDLGKRRDAGIPRARPRGSQEREAKAIGRVQCNHKTSGADSRLSNNCKVRSSHITSF